MKKKLKNSFYYKAYKLSLDMEMPMKDGVGLLRETAELKMNRRIVKKPNRVYDGTPLKAWESFVEVPVINKRTNKVLWYKLEKVDEKLITLPENVTDEDKFYGWLKFDKETT